MFVAILSFIMVSVPDGGLKATVVPPVAVAPAPAPKALVPPA